jgi:hypothetical protein
MQGGHPYGSGITSCEESESAIANSSGSATDGVLKGQGPYRYYKAGGETGPSALPDGNAASAFYALEGFKTDSGVVVGRIERLVRVASERIESDGDIAVPVLNIKKCPGAYSRVPAAILILFQGLTAARGVGAASAIALQTGATDSRV